MTRSTEAQGSDSERVLKIYNDLSKQVNVKYKYKRGIPLLMIFLAPTFVLVGVPLMGISRIVGFFFIALAVLSYVVGFPYFRYVKRLIRLEVEDIGKKYPKFPEFYHLSVKKINDEAREREKQKLLRIIVPIVVASAVTAVAIEIAADGARKKAEL